MKQPQPEVGAADPQAARRKPRKRRANHVDLSVGGRLRQARLLAGASQEEVGNAVGVSFQAVQKYENGENRLSAGRLAAEDRALIVATAARLRSEPGFRDQLAALLEDRIGPALVAPLNQARGAGRVAALGRHHRALRSATTPAPGATEGGRFGAAAHEILVLAGFTGPARAGLSSPPSCWACRSP